MGLPQHAQEHDGVEYDPSHIEGEHAQSKRRSRKPRKRSAARKAKEHEKLEAKWRARRESVLSRSPLCRKRRARLLHPPYSPTPEQHSTRRAKPSTPGSATLCETSRFESRTGSVRVDMAAVLDECLAVRAAADAEVNRGIRVSRFEVLQRTLARLKDFEGELLLATAPEGHMEPEWSAQV